MTKEVLPLHTLEELLKWPEGVNQEKACDWVIDIKPRTKRFQIDDEIHDVKDSYRTLVCHDYKGGYLDDRFCDGSSNNKAYKFSNWNGIDSFVYFSHYFITIPPCGWIKVAHQHGVKMMGTIITEGADGVNTWNEILDSEEMMKQVIDQLCKITSAFKIDGWLINIENYIETPNELIKFITLFNEEIHALNNELEVIWYDAVIHTGAVRYQNELNDNNKVFFDLCDGIFLNYGWSTQNLQNSKNNAGERYLDVYAGIDMCGRGTYGGGGFATYKGFVEIRKQPLSAAVFAQGWTDMELQYRNFFANENNLWATLQPYLLYHGVVGVPEDTSLCRGFGEFTYENAAVVDENNWFNLAKQQTQPLWEVMRNSTIALSMQTNDIYEGGSMASVWCDVYMSCRFFVVEFKVEDVNCLNFYCKLTNGLSVTFWCNYETPEGVRSPKTKLPMRLKTNPKTGIPKTRVNDSWQQIVVTMGNLPANCTIRSLGVDLNGTGVIHIGKFEYETK